MKIKWNRVHTVILIGIICSCIGLYFWGYFQFVSPVQSKILAVTEQLEIQEQIIANADLLDTEVEDGSILSTNSQKKLSVDKNLNQLLLLLDEITNANAIEIQQISTVDNSLDDTTLQQLISYSENIESLSIQLQVNSNTQEDLTIFLQKLSDLERIVNVDTIQITTVSEQQMQANIGFTTFYNPTLTALKIESPIFEYDQEQEQVDQESEEIEVDQDLEQEDQD